VGKCEHYFEEGITFTIVTSSVNSFRFSPLGNIYDVSGPTMYPIKPDYLKYILGFLISPICHTILNFLNPTLSLQIGDVKKLPLIINNDIKSIIDNIVTANIALSRADWDAFETSWDFKRHPLI
jgi:hypothetical protein